MSPAHNSSRAANLLLFGPALCWIVAAGLGLGWTATDPAAWAAVDRHGDPVVGSDRCAACHPAQWTSWRHSWHRTMTQPILFDGVGAGLDGGAKGRAGGADSLTVAQGARVGESAPGQDGVLAPFAGEHLDYLGFRATMDRSPEGGPRVQVTRLEGGEVGREVLSATVSLTVGSHRYQQYVAELPAGTVRGERALWRLPVAWHREEARWIHMNAAFVEPEGEAGSVADYQRHLNRWNDNCLFCHNTEAAPGFDLDRPEAGFASEAGELGIACEACHGPADAHVARHRNPFRRLLAGGGEPGARADASIVQPEHLDPGRESAICGRCHGQRIARDIAGVLRHGDGFIPGDALESVSRPIFADTELDGEEGVFAQRFWPDGSPRLSAYEYQGLLTSPCWQGPEGPGAEGSLGCGHCHTMHGDEADGQLRPERRGAGACVDCHETASLGGGASPGGHGGHGELAREVDCLDCHMPKTTYGLLEGMISHRITSPDPGRWLGRHDQPDACTQCHVDRSRAWAADAMARLGSVAAGPSEPGAHSGETPQVVLDLLGGDPIQRNLAAHALAEEKATGSFEVRAAWIAEGLEDEYPSVRWFAWRGLRRLVTAAPADHPDRAALLAELDRFDYIGPIRERVVVVSAIRARLLPPPLVDQPERRAALVDARQGRAIWIGE